MTGQAPLDPIRVAPIRVAAYVSGHGYGHAVRAAGVAAALAHRGAVVTILSDAHPEAFEPLREGVRLERSAVDVGVVQHGSLEHDETATLDRFAAFTASFAGRVPIEADRLRALEADVVVADVAPLGVLAADHAGLPSVVVANFTWDEIYRPWADRDPRAAVLADRVAAMYARATLLLETPLALPLPAFARREWIPIIARRGLRDRKQTRAALGIGEETLVVLVAFGGIGPPDLAPPSDVAGLDVLFLGYTALGWPADRYRVVDRDAFPHPDLVGAVDLVLGKPGYGTVAECAVAGTPLLWVGRERWAEMPALIRGIEDHTGGRPLAADELRSGRLAAAIRQALETPPRVGPLTPGGADAAAERVLMLARARRE